MSLSRLQPVRLCIRLVMGACFLLASPLAVTAATCCRCDAPSSADKICLAVTEGDCANVVAQSTNPNVKALTSCVTFGVPNEGSCRTIPEGGTCKEISDPLTYGISSNTDEANFGVSEEKPLVLNTPIPGLSFSSKIPVSEGYLYVSYLAQYIDAIYKYLVAISIIVATIMIVYGGFLYLVGASLSNVKRGRTIIVDACIGLALLFGSYTILGTVNPETVNLKVLQIQQIPTANDQGVIDQLGTGNPDASAEDLERSLDPNVDGSAPPIKEVQGHVDISGITIEKNLGAAANLAKFCARSADISAADTPAEKRALLARAVLGFKKVCVDERLCAYCQSGGTDIPGGDVRCSGNGLFAAVNLIDNGLFTPEGLWGSDQACIDIWNDPNKRSSLLTNEQCKAVSVPIYSQAIANAMEKAGMAGYDCGGAVFSMYNCAGSKNHKKAQFTDKKTKQLVGYPGKTAVIDDPSRSDSILFNVPLDQAVGRLSTKGGLQFGDLIHICCGKSSFASHWFMYTGGRSDVDFAFIEMGGVGSGGRIFVPFIGGDGKFSVSGIQVKPKSWALRSYIANLVKNGWNASEARIWVWRPYAE